MRVWLSAAVRRMTGMPLKGGEESKYILEAIGDSSQCTCHADLHFTSAGFAYVIKYGSDLYLLKRLVHKKVGQDNYVQQEGGRFQSWPRCSFWVDGLMASFHAQHAQNVHVKSVGDSKLCMSKLATSPEVWLCLWPNTAGMSCTTPSKLDSLVDLYVQTQASTCRQSAVWMWNDPLTPDQSLLGSALPLHLSSALRPPFPTLSSTSYFSFLLFSLGFQPCREPRVWHFSPQNSRSQRGKEQRAARVQVIFCMCKSVCLWWVVTKKNYFHKWSW